MTHSLALALSLDRTPLHSSRSAAHDQASSRAGVLVASLSLLS